MRRESKLSRCWGRIRSQYYIYRDPWCPPWLRETQIGTRCDGHAPASLVVSPIEGPTI
ncbi:hypothetical protein GQ607_014975 [Colletotrichum asianum]|uniref:Uncharacterized protein n=1 Tax=Colletotrichum asianum TaxID=702518 RepID=A0A8H3ZN88_9PEZI|nr:hypothetical protein GQ607_014975 [Colletotrichum asianum]